MRVNCRAHSHQAQNLTRIEAMRVSSERDDDLGAPADHVVSKDQQLDEERPMYAKEAVRVSQAALRGAIQGISKIIESATTALTTIKSHNGKKWTDNRLQTMSEGLVYKIPD